MMGLYCHIPFCRRKCPYCNFYSVPSLHLIPAFISAIKREVELYRERDVFSDHAGKDWKMDTLYFGGGTPSIFEPEWIGDLIHHFQTCFPFTEHMEITLEANPGDLSFQDIEVLLKVGINRLNLGVQSFNPDNLIFLGRGHSTEQAKKSVKIARDSGITNLGLDLIYGLPGQSIKSWLEDLDQAIDSGPEHISCYQLTIEDRTVFGRKLKQGKILPITKEEEYEFFLMTSKRLTHAGYLHYEVSNFARGKHHVSRHNSKYWRHIPYLGLGPSAHSFSGEKRWWNHKSIEQYCSDIRAGRFPVEGSEILTEEDMRLESLYLGFRTRNGLDLRRFKDRFGQDLRRDPPGILPFLVEQGKIELKTDRATPTLEGMAVADALPLLF